MNKLLLVSIIVLQGASVFAMDASGKKLSGEAAVSYRRITEQANLTTQEALAAVFEKHPELPNWKTRKHIPLLFCFIEANNSEAVRFLLLHGADVNVEHNRQTAEMVAGKRKKILSLLEKFRRGESIALEEAAKQDVMLDSSKENADNDEEASSWLSHYLFRKINVIPLLGFAGYLAYRKLSGKKAQA